ncbi:MAG: OB-fold domain-containing protein [Pigmentiphaga sp.]
MDAIQHIFDPMEKAFREGAQRKELLIPHCESCQAPHWYPRPVCPHCGHPGMVFKASAGTGSIYSLTRLRRKNAAPHTLVYVALDEGVTLLSQLINDSAEQTRIGQRVEVDFVQQDNGLNLPVFKLIQS